MMEPLEEYQEPRPYFYYRKFQNGLAVLNAGGESVTLTDREYANFGFQNYDAPQIINPKTGAIFIKNCSLVTAEQSCRRLYNN